MIASLLALIGCGEKANPAFKALIERAMTDLQTKTASHKAPGIWENQNGGI
jgi:hypothetical protein